MHWEIVAFVQNGRQVDCTLWVFTISILTSISSLLILYLVKFWLLSAHSSCEAMLCQCFYIIQHVLPHYWFCYWVSALAPDWKLWVFTVCFSQLEFWDRVVHIFKHSSPGCYFLTIVSFTVILLGGGGGDSQPLHIGCLVKKSKRSNLCIHSKLHILSHCVIFFVSYRAFLFCLFCFLNLTQMLYGGK